MRLRSSQNPGRSNERPRRWPELDVDRRLAIGLHALTLIVAGAALWAALRQASLARQAMENTTRAWIHFDKASELIELPIKGRGDEPVFVDIDMWNTGSGTARVTTYRRKVQFIKADDVAPSPNYVREEGDFETFAVTLGGGQRSSIPFAVGRMGEKQAERIESGEEFLTFFAHLTYEDQYGNERFTKMCRYWSPVRRRLETCSVYNDAN